MSVHGPAAGDEDQQAEQQKQNRDDGEEGYQQILTARFCFALHFDFRNTLRRAPKGIRILSRI